MSEREEISRGAVAGHSIRSIATSLGRASSTVSREIQRNGGRRQYRACKADQAAWDRAHRRKICKLADNPALARSSLPAENLKIKERGSLREGNFADIAIIDPASVSDRAIFAEPHQCSTGMQHVLVNGVLVLLGGEHTGATPGTFVKGHGYK